MKNLNIKNSLLLALTALVWGIAFVSQKSGGDAVGCFTFNAIRSFIGGVVLIPLVLFTIRKEKNVSGEKSASFDLKGGIWGGICCGFMLFIASNLQQIGIKYTSAGKAGFITALYIIIVPFLSILLGKKMTFRIWIGAAAAVIGMYFLCVSGGEWLTLGNGALFLSSVWFAFHILVIDHFAEKHSGIFLSCVQFFTCAILSAIMIPLYESPSVSNILSGCIPILYAGIMSCGVGYTLQIVGQKNMNPTVASLILSLESVFAVISGGILLGEVLSVREIIGCTIMFAAIIFVQLPDRKPKSINDFTDIK